MIPVGRLAKPRKDAAWQLSEMPSAMSVTKKSLFGGFGLTASARLEARA